MIIEEVAVSNAISHEKPTQKLVPIVVATTLVACLLGVYTMLARSSWTARPSTLEADPLGHTDSAEPLAPSQAARRVNISRDPDAPGRRF